jgi:glycosyltransferase involved in cell wall biosynthesis
MFMTQSNVKISVLLTVFNTDFSKVKRAIDSVLLQTYNNIELIIIDDGSHKENNDELLNYCDSLFINIKYIYHENIGQSKSVNIGVLQSKGEYITMLDSDDEYKINHLEYCLQHMNDADLIASITDTIIENNEDYYVPDKNNNAKLIHVDDCILFATLFGKREVFASIMFEDGYSADSAFYEKASELFITKKVDLRTYIYYRDNKNSICSVLKNKALESI